jgi:hypothetical protein
MRPCETVSAINRGGGKGNPESGVSVRGASRDGVEESTGGIGKGIEALSIFHKGTKAPAVLEKAEEGESGAGPSDRPHRISEVFLKGHGPEFSTALVLTRAECEKGGMDSIRADAYAAMHTRLIRTKKLSPEIAKDAAQAFADAYVGARNSERYKNFALIFAEAYEQVYEAKNGHDYAIIYAMAFVSALTADHPVITANSPEYYFVQQETSYNVSAVALALPCAWAYRDILRERGVPGASTYDAAVARVPERFVEVFKQGYANAMADGFCGEMAARAAKYWADKLVPGTKTPVPGPANT